MSEDSARPFIAKICLAYLSCLYWDMFRAEFPFAQYAAEYWEGHAQISEATDEGLVEMIVSFMSKEDTAFWTSQVLCEPKNLRDEEHSPTRGAPKRNIRRSVFPSPLYHAALYGLTYTMKRLLDQGAVVDAQKDQNGFFKTALQAASFWGDHDAVKILLSNGADVNAHHIGHYGTALHVASSGGRYGSFCGEETRWNLGQLDGHKQTVQLLLDYGANINAQGGSYGSVIVAASSACHADIAKVLLDNPYLDCEYAVPLVEASKSGCDEIVEMLLARGADVSAQDTVGHNALNAALHHGKEKTVEILLAHGVDVHTQDELMGSTLQAAAKSGCVHMFQMLLDRGVDIAVQGGNSYFHGSALEEASGKGSYEIVKILLDKGVDVNAQKGDDGPALLRASSQGQHEVVKLLLDNGANVNVRGTDCNTALILASKYGHDDVVEILIANRANIHAQSEFKDHAITAASRERRVQVVRILLDEYDRRGTRDRGVGHIHARDRAWADRNGFLDSSQT